MRGFESHHGPLRPRAAGDTVLGLAAEVIETSGRERPADAALRDLLRGRRDLSPDKRRRISEAVFAYFRWWGWLDPRAPLEVQLRQGLALRRDFAAAPDSFPAEDLLARAIPSWVRDLMEVTPAWLRSLQAEPALWLRARPGTGRLLASSLGACRSAGTGPAADALEYRGGEDLFRTDTFREGRFELQDLHSQAVGWMCAPKPGETWWDACAGEGGKTLLLSDLMENQGLIWASDAAAWRLQRLKLRARRAGVFNYRLAPWDGGERPPTRTRFDGVLVDAPCSNLGTWGRNPHARWTTEPKDVRELAELQSRLLDHAAPAVKPGGRLVYAVCTLLPAETLEVAARFGAGHPEFAGLRLPHPFQASAAPAAAWFLRPEETRGNGMYVAAWQRSGPPAA